MIEARTTEAPPGEAQAPTEETLVAVVALLLMGEAKPPIDQTLLGAVAALLAPVLGVACWGGRWRSVYCLQPVFHSSR